MPTRLKEGETYVIKSPFERVEMKFSARGALCEAIKFNQAGYNPASRRRYAFYAPWSGDLPADPGAWPSEFEILSAVGRHPVGKGMLERCDPDPRVGGPVWRIDLSNVPGPERLLGWGDGAGATTAYSLMLGRRVQGEGAWFRGPIGEGREAQMVRGAKLSSWSWRRVRLGVVYRGRARDRLVI